MDRRGLSFLSAEREAKKKVIEEAAPEDRAGRPISFVPPEYIDEEFDAIEQDPSALLARGSSWDVAVRYHDFKTRPALKTHRKQLRRVSADAILRRAQDTLGAVSRPTDTRVVPLLELPSAAQDADIELEETLDHGGRRVASPADIWMSYQVTRERPLVLVVDTSLSMTGEKLALTAVALAVVLLQFPEAPIGVIAFESEASVVRKPAEHASVLEVIERFLDVPARGYTHLENGLLAALRLMRDFGSGARNAQPPVVLITDGKYTAGRDPAYLGPRFEELDVLQMGQERAGRGLCVALAGKGKGTVRTVVSLEALPREMYGLVKDLLRSR